MSISLDTFGGSTDRGQGFFVLDDNGTHHRIPPDNLSTSETLGVQNSNWNQGIWGRDSGVILSYSTTPYVKYFRDPGDNIQSFGKFGYIDFDANPFSADYPFSVSYVNNQFVTLSTQVSGSAVVIYKSDDGLSWTKVTTGPTAQGNGFPGRMVYNEDDDRYAFASRVSNHIFYSDDNMETWASVTPGTGTVYDIDYGNGIWIASYFSNGAYFSTNNMSTWSNANFPFSAYNVMYNENDQRFFIGGGSRQGANNYDARIAYTINGSSWTTAYSGTANVYVNSIKGDNNGNYVAAGFTDDGAAFIGTTAYLYSTNNGTSWSEGAFPTTVEMGYPNSIFYADGTENIITAAGYNPEPGE